MSEKFVVTISDIEQGRALAAGRAEAFVERMTKEQKRGRG